MLFLCYDLYWEVHLALLLGNDLQFTRLQLEDGSLRECCLLAFKLFFLRVVPQG
jgi:hypothetical protein